jgi:hypothetical protein
MAPSAAGLSFSAQKIDLERRQRDRLIVSNQLPLPIASWKQLKK